MSAIIKMAIVRLALRGVISPRVATALIGHLRLKGA